ncbi:ethanolamine ammonia-lyase subunit EutB [Bradyrhizobium niftali]|nr:ethanolamine ammonia-lyase subunit EutB [Bradyrhizobium niftali]
MTKVMSERTGDQLVGIAADGLEERLAARWRSQICRSRPGRRTDSGRTDDVSRLILDRHDPAAFAIVSSLTVGELLIPLNVAHHSGMISPTVPI